MSVKAISQTIIWAKGSVENNFPSLYGGYYVDAYVTASTTDKNGDIYVAGAYENCSVDFGAADLYGSPAGSGNTFIIKYDSSGNVLWGLHSTGNSDYVSSIFTDIDGNVIITGNYVGFVSFGADSINDSRHGFSNYFLYKFDSSGNVLWHKTGNGLGYEGVGNYDAKTDDSGNVYFLGTYGTGTISFGSYLLTNSSSSYPYIFLGDTSYPEDIFLVKYDHSGNVIWAKNAGGSTSDIAGELAIDKRGNAYIYGQYNSPLIAFDTFTLTNVHGTFTPGLSPNIYLVKYNTAGQVVWADNIGANENVDPEGIITTKSGDIYITGSFQVGLFVDSVLLTCDTPSTSNGFLARYDSSGNFVSILQFGGNGNAKGTNMGYGAISGNVYLCGTFNTRGAIAIGSALIGQLDTSSYGATSFIMAYNETNTGSEIINCFDVFPVAYDWPLVAVDAWEHLYMSGTFRKPMFISPGDTLQNTSESSVYSMRFQNCAVLPGSTLVKGIANPDDILLYPNPATEQITLSNPHPSGNRSTIEIYDITGRLVQTNVLNGNTTTLSISALPQGTYICRIAIDDVITMTKIVVY